MNVTRKNYLKYINPLELLQTKKVLKVNPTMPSDELQTEESIVTLFEYSKACCTLEHKVGTEKIVLSNFKKERNYWINIDVLNKNTIEEIGKNLSIHPLIIEDILHEDQRPKMEEVDNFVLCILQMMYFNDTQNGIESEQLSIVFGENYLLSFQDEAERDLFNPIRDRLKIEGSKIRNLEIDYLCYLLLDSIVDHYFIVLEKLSDQIEHIEEEVSRHETSNFSMNEINYLRKQLILFKRNVVPVRELLNNIIKSDNALIKEKNKRYFKDVYDHILQASDLAENYRDVVTNIRDLYLSQVNLKMNEIMKFLAIVTTLFAPATVIGGIFGMNFERIPWLHSQNGFWIATFIMIAIPIVMLIYFRQKKWF